MKILVLGSGGRADCRQCAASTADSRPPSSRLPGAIAVTGVEQRWLLINAAPEIARHAQIESAAQQGRIAGVVLLDAQLEHAASLAELSRGGPLNLYATPAVFEELTCRLPMLGLPEGGGAVRWHLLPVAGDVRSAEFRVEGLESLRFVAVDDGGWAAPYSPYGAEAVVGDSVSLLIEDRRAGQRLVYSPAAGGGARPWMEGADCLLVAAAGCRDLPVPTSPTIGLADTGARRTVLVHLDDCDPRLHEGSEARRAIDAAGIEVAFDGMEIEL
ncbi:MAG: MBL fold metallo-hydrolase [Piscinibacter sp.]